MDELCDMQIELAKAAGFSDEKLNLLNNNEYDFYQIEQIRIGIEKDIPLDQIKIYAKPIYDAEQMNLIRRGLLHVKAKEWGIEVVYLYARPEMSLAQMQQIFIGLQDGLNLVNVKDYAAVGFSPRRMAMQRMAMMLDNSMSVKSFAKKFNEPTIDPPGHGHINLDIFDNNQTNEIRLARKAGLNDEQIGIMANKDFAADQMHAIRWGFEQDSLSIEQVSVYAKPCFNANQMGAIRSGFTGGKLSLEQVNIYASSEFTYKQMVVLREALKGGIDAEQLSYICNKDIPDYIMNEIWIGLRQNVSIEQIIIDIRNGTYPGLSKEQTNFLSSLLENKLIERRT